MYISFTDVSRSPQNEKPVLKEHVIKPSHACPIYRYVAYFKIPRGALVSHACDLDKTVNESTSVYKLD